MSHTAESPVWYIPRPRAVLTGLPDLQPNRVKNEPKELRLLCAEDEQSHACWLMAFRLLKVVCGVEVRVRAGAGRALWTLP